VGSDNDLAVSFAALEGFGATRGRSYLRAGASPCRARGRQMQWQRHDVVRALYAIARGKEGVVVDLDDLLSATGMPDAQVYNALDRLEQDGAVQSFNGHCVTLLRKGIDAFERAATKPYRVMSAATSPPSSLRPSAGAGPGLVAAAAPPAGPPRSPRS
jgi:hypothetical protein